MIATTLDDVVLVYLHINASSAPTTDYLLYLPTYLPMVYLHKFYILEVTLKFAESLRKPLLAIYVGRYEIDRLEVMQNERCGEI